MHEKKLNFNQANLLIFVTYLLYVKVPSSSDTALTESQGEESVASVNGNVDEPKRLDVAAEDAALVDSKLPKPKSRFTVKTVPKEVYSNKFID